MHLKRLDCSLCCNMRPSMVSALWVLTMLVALDFVVHASSIKKLEDSSVYTNCIAEPAGCESFTATVGTLFPVSMTVQTLSAGPSPRSWGS